MYNENNNFNNNEILKNESKIVNNNLEQASAKSKKKLCTFIMMIVFLAALVLSIIALKSVLEGRKDFDEVAHIIIPTVIIMETIAIGPMLSKNYKLKQTKKRAQIQQQIKL